MSELLRIICGDALTELRKLESESVQCCVTSPPYFGLRDYGIDGQLGLEPTPENYVTKLTEIMREVRRVLKDDGTLWLNLGDSYARSAGDDSTKATDNGMRTGRTGREAMLFKSGNNRPPDGLKPKDLIGIPWRVAFALQSDGWWLRSDIIWSKPNPMPESVTDRPTKAHEYLFLMAKSPSYYYDAEAIKEPSTDSTAERAAYGWNGKMVFDANGKEAFRSQPDPVDEMGERWCPENRNKRSVWTVTTQSYREAHFATFPPDLIKPCILAGTKPGDVVLDPFFGSGTTGMVALELGRRCIGIELNPEYVKLAENRCNVTPGLPF